MGCDMADSVEIISGIICGVYKSSTGTLAKKNTIKYLTSQSEIQAISELAKQKSQWGKSKYILHILLWGLRDYGFKAIILQDMSDENIALLKETVAIIKNYEKPDQNLAEQLSNEYKNKKTALSLGERYANTIGRFSAQIALKVAENWDEVVAELNLWENMLGEFKRDYKKKQKRESYRRHQPEIRKKQRTYYYTHQPEILDQKHQYWDANKDDINAKRRRQYKKNPTAVHERNRKYQTTHRDSIYATNKKYRERMQQTAETAMKVCAAYVFLMNLKKQDPGKYSELYTRKQNPLCGMLKNCVALQKMDITMCPFCNDKNGNMIEECCNQKLLAVPNAIEEMQAISRNLVQNGAQNGR